MICRKIDWISDWISASVFSGAGAAATGVSAFSEAGCVLDEEDFLDEEDGLLKI